MEIPVHFASINWAGHERVDPDQGAIRDLVLARLATLDGRGVWAFGFWPLPDGTHPDRPERTAAFEYMQSAGTANRMTVEVRWFEDDDVLRQYVVGREHDEIQGAPWEDIPWGMNGHVVRVRPHEAFTAEQAAAVYEAYFETGNVPSGCTLRYLDMSVDPAV